MTIQSYDSEGKIKVKKIATYRLASLDLVLLGLFLLCFFLLLLPQFSFLPRNEGLQSDLSEILSLQRRSLKVNSRQWGKYLHEIAV